MAGLKSSLKNIAKSIKKKIPFLRKGRHSKGKEVSVKPLLAYFVVKHLDESGKSITRSDVQKAFREATRTLQTAGYMRKGKHTLTDVGIKALEAVRLRDDYNEIQDRYGAILAMIRSGKPRTYSESDAPMSTPLLMEAGADISSSSTMVAIYPPSYIAAKASSYADEEIPVDDLHVTLVYLGETEPSDFDTVVKCVQSCAQMLAPVRVRVAGSGCFYNDESAVRHFLIDSSGLAEVRRRIAEMLSDNGLVTPSKFGWIPHMTLGYHKDRELPDDWEKAADGDFDEWLCDNVWVVRGNDHRVRVPLGGV